MDSYRCAAGRSHCRRGLIRVTVLLAFWTRWRLAWRWQEPVKTGPDFTSCAGIVGIFRHSSRGCRTPCAKKGLIRQGLIHLRKSWKSMVENVPVPRVLQDAQKVCCHHPLLRAVCSYESIPYLRRYCNLYTVVTLRSQAPADADVRTADFNDCGESLDSC